MSSLPTRALRPPQWTLPILRRTADHQLFRRESPRPQPQELPQYCLGIGADLLSLLGNLPPPRSPTPYAFPQGEEGLS